MRQAQQEINQELVEAIIHQKYQVNQVQHQEKTRSAKSPDFGVNPNNLNKPP